jgi:hypothetical protein
MTHPTVSIECGKLESQLAAFSLPPQEQVSICSDDSDSLSSLSSEGSSCSEHCDATPASANQRRRSVFKTYWEKNCGSPLQLRVNAPENDNDVNSIVHDSQSSCNSPDSVSNDANSYERALKVNEGVEHPRNALGDSGRRRRIFTAACPSFLSELEIQSLPGLCFDYHNNVRLTKSSPEFRRNPGPSCLQRACRYSGNQRRSFGRSSSCSVTFDPNISILRYKETKEHWAASGWSKYFAN